MLIRDCSSRSAKLTGIVARLDSTVDQKVKLVAILALIHNFKVEKSAEKVIFNKRV